MYLFTLRFIVLLARLRLVQRNFMLDTSSFILIVVTASDIPSISQCTYVFKHINILLHIRPKLLILSFENIQDEEEHYIGVWCQFL